MNLIRRLSPHFPTFQWIFTALLSLTFTQLYWGPVDASTPTLMATTALLAIALQRGFDFIPRWELAHSRPLYLQAYKAFCFITLSAPAFALMIQEGIRFGLLVGAGVFVFNELLDQIKHMVEHLQWPASQATKEAEPLAPDQDGAMAKDPLHQRLHHHFTGKTILITGAGRHSLETLLSSYKPAHLILVANSVENLSKAYQDIRNNAPMVEVTPRLELPDHKIQIQHIFEEFTPDALIHGHLEGNSALLDNNPSYTARVNIIDTMDWIEAARKNGVSEFALLLPTDPASQTAGQCLQLVHNYVEALRAESINHPTKIMVLEEDEPEAVLAQYLHGLSQTPDVSPVKNFPIFLRALHHIDKAVKDVNDTEVQGLLNALAPTETEEVAKAA